MLCDECKQREATYHRVTQINGIVKEEHLCASCEQKRKSKTEFPLFDALFNFGFNDSSNLVKSKRVCPVCGMSLSEFYDTGIVGCENCYDEFAAQILPTIQKNQPQVANVGKGPSPKKKERSPEYIRLKQELAQAVEVEDYERAAQLHEQIKKMEKEGE